MLILIPSIMMQTSYTMFTSMTMRNFLRDSLHSYFDSTFVWLISKRSEDCIKFICSMLFLTQCIQWGFFFKIHKNNSNMSSFHSASHDCYVFFSGKPPYYIRLTTCNQFWLKKAFSPELLCTHVKIISNLPPHHQDKASPNPPGRQIPVHLSSPSQSCDSCDMVRQIWAAHDKFRKPYR